jgi:sporulation protein YlmC with PRC-barrel domain
VAEMNMHEHDLVRASELMGYAVRNPMKEKLGRIEEVIIDVTTGRLAFAVLSFEPSLGMGEKLYAVPWRALAYKPDEREFVFEVDRERLESAPGFSRKRWPKLADRTWGAEIATYYGHRPYWEVVI